MLAAAALAVAARGVERRNTWYLASDQFAFLTFAGDLARGTVFHEPSLLELLVPRPNPERTYDARVQTYLWREGKLYSRYPPGFPALLAAAGMVGGERAQHWLNPLLYLTILALLGFLTWELVRPNDRALAAGSAVAAMWLLLLLPTDVHLWGITVARDLPAHLLALLSLLAAVRLRWVASGLALGLACTIRPDAVLYGVSLGALFRLEGARLRDLVLGAAAFVLGALPLFAYNTVTQGHPLAFTQGGEFRDVLGALGTRGVALAQTISFGSGGAFQLANLWQTLPGNLTHLGRSLGWLVVLTALGLVWGVRVRRPLAAAFAPYPVVAVLFYSCWSHPDARYLAGAALCLLPLTAVGAAVTCRLVGDERRSHGWRVLALMAAAVVLGQGMLPGWLRVPGIGLPERALAAALAVSALLALAPRAARANRLAPLLPALALTGIALFIVFTARGSRDPYQRAQIERARHVLGALIPPGSLVIASESLGRPVENLRHYLDANAFYLGEFPLFVVAREGAIGRSLVAGKRVFLLLRGEDRETLRSIRNNQARLIGRAHGRQLYDWFVDPGAAPFGAALYEIEPSPFTLQLRDMLREEQGRPER
ncbi:MAG: hypothetical protein AB1689_17065 [Thermodesulfobacteriota bacterium]